jgi:hypothetical protein
MQQPAQKVAQQVVCNDRASLRQHGRSLHAQPGNGVDHAMTVHLTHVGCDSRSPKLGGKTGAMLVCKHQLLTHLTGLTAHHVSPKA